MSVHTEHPVSGARTSSDNGIFFIAGAVMFLSFGLTLSIFTVFYVHDAATLFQLPGIVWDFLCGVPNDSGAALPILVLLSLATYAAAAVIWIVYRIRRRSWR